MRDPRDAARRRTPVRVGVFNDSATVRALLRATLQPLPDFEVVLEAEDGRHAAALCDQAEVGLVLMDVVMPHVDGLRATREIVARSSIPVIVVSSVINVADPAELFSAMQAGAVFVMEPPKTGDSGRSAAAFVQMLRNIARSESLPMEPPEARSGIPTPRDHGGSLPAVPTPADSEIGAATPRVVGLAASAGGPGATAEVLRAARAANARAGVLLVQHLAAGFSPSYAQWLARESGMPVTVAEEGAAVRAGSVYLAPTGCHLTYVGGRCHLTRGQDVSIFCPSADQLLLSLAALGPRAAAVVLSGMGADGAQGAAAIRAGGGRVVVQTPESCAVASMPRKIVHAGDAHAVLPTDEIGRWIASL